MIHPEMSEFLDFVESKRPDEDYCFSEAESCACGQYAASIGIMRGDWMKEMSEGSFWQDANALAGQGSHYFGPLAARIRQHMKEEAVA